jgi:nicotinate-nucleotide adenylyltransferase
MPRTKPHTSHSFTVRPPFAVSGQTIGLLGGSFNPAHEAHRLISRIAYERLGLDRVWWIVSPGNPLKDKSQLASLDERIGSARLVAPDAFIEITSFESALPTTFTAATVSFLLARYPGVRFVWLMGADNLAQVHRWQQWQSIFERVPVAVIDRPGWHLKSLASRGARTFADRRVPEIRCRAILTNPLPAWTFLTGPLSIKSSSAIRAARRKN